MIYDTIIIGAGPAGLTAGIYAMRGKLKALCIEKENAGGRIAEAGIVENYPGFEEIRGYELAEKFKIPLLIGGATTSELHTAIKLAPIYSGPLMHISDASKSVQIATKLMAKDEKESLDRYKSKVRNQIKKGLKNCIVEKVKKETPKIYRKELIELLFEQPYSKIEFVVDKLKVERKAASRYLKNLENIGILKSEKIGRENLYLNKELIEILKH